MFVWGFGVVQWVAYGGLRFGAGVVRVKFFEILGGGAPGTTLHRKI